MASIGFKAGEAYIQVNPSVEGWYDKIREDLTRGRRDPVEVPVEPNVDLEALDRKIDDLADRMRQKMAAAMAGRDSGVNEGLREQIDELGKQLDEALRERELLINESQAEAKIAGLNERLDEVFDKEREVKESTAEAEAKAEALGQSLDRAVERERVAHVSVVEDRQANTATDETDYVGRHRAPEDVTIREDVDNADALAKTEETRAAVDSLPDEKTIHIEADTSAAEAQVSAFGMMLAGLGSVASPLGGAAVGGLGTALTFIPGAITGLFTLKEATSGATDALGAYNQMQLTAARYAPQMAAAQSAASEKIQSSQLQLTSAERNLQTTRESVANAAISASERVQRAQEGVAKAQESAAAGVESALRSQQRAEEELQRAQEQEERAQESLTQARKDAAQQLIDLNFSVQDNALSQRAAAIRLQEAQLTQASHGTLPAGSLVAQKDQLAVDEAQQRIVELAAKQKELTDKKATADQQGIDGNPRVVAAQDAVTQAVQRTADAHQNVADAAKKVQQAQIDGARRIADAQMALGDAQRAQALQSEQGAARIASAQDAVTRAQMALAKAHDATSQATNRNAQAQALYEYALSKLTPAGQEFVKFLETLVGPQGLLRQIQHTAEDGFLPGLESGLKAGLEDLPQFNQLIGVTATELGSLADKAGHALTGTAWTQFLQYMTQEAPFAIRTFGTIAGNTFSAFFGYAEAFKPIFEQWGQGFVNMTARWAQAGQDARNGTKPFSDFLEFVRASGTEVAAFFRQFADLLGHIAEGLALPGLGTLSLLTTALRVLNGMDPQILGLLIQTFLMMRLLGQSGVGGFLTNMAAGLSTSAAQASNLQKAMLWMGTSEATVNKVSSALGRFAQTLPLIGAALVALGYAWDALRDKSNESASAIIAGTKTLSQAVQDEVDRTHNSWTAAFSFDGSFENEQVARKNALDRVTQALQDQVAALGPVQRAQAEATIAQQQYELALRDNPPTSQAVADALANYKTKQDAATKATDDGKRATESYTDSLKRLSDEIDKNIDAKIATMNADLQLKQASKDVTDAIAKGGRTTDDYTRAQASMLSAIKANIDAAQQQAEANYKGADSQEKARVGAQAHDLALIQLAQSQDGPVRDAALETIKNLDSTQLATLNATLAMQGFHVEIVQTPSGKEVTITTPGMDQALGDFKKLNDLIQQISPAQVGGALTVALSNAIMPPGHATGGPIYGPGGPTEDKVPAMLSAGEHVLTAREVQAAGGHQGVFNLRSAILSGMTPKHYAEGGPVGLGGFGTPAGPNAVKLVLEVSEPPAFKDALARMEALQAALSSAGGGDLGGWIAAAMAITGVPAYWAAGLRTLIMRESGGNPNAINLTDSNARAGHPSQGLMQTIPGTFNAYRDPRLPDNITDPVANIVAGINYIRARYGDISNVQQANPNLPPRGYDSGGILPPGMHTVVNATRQPERVLSARQTAVFEDAMHHLTRNGPQSGGDTWNISPPPEWDYLRMAQEVTRIQDLRDRTR